MNAITVQNEPVQNAIGLDIGDARIGIAGADPTGFIATPIETLERTTEKNDLRQILKIAENQKASHIVVGLPLSLNGSIGPQAKKIIRLVKNLRIMTTIPVETWDERYSTVEAQRILRQVGKRSARNRAR